MAKKKGAKKKVAKRKAAKKKSATLSAKSRAAKAAPKPAPKKSARLRAGRGRRKGKTYSFENTGIAETRDSAAASERAGQAGDLQGLSDVEDADAESVEELLEEGQSFEAEAVAGVEDAPDADRGPVRTHEVKEDDVPDEYLEDGKSDV
jgi:hypothetical protein